MPRLEDICRAVLGCVAILGGAALTGLGGILGWAGGYGMIAALAFVPTGIGVVTLGMSLITMRASRPTGRQWDGAPAPPGPL